MKTPAFLLLMIASVSAPITSMAQDYPNRPITWIIPVGTGSGADNMARLIGPRLAERLKQPVIVENKPGASQTIGMDFVAKAAPNGYTVVMLLNNITMVPALLKNVPFNLAADFVGVSRIATSGMTLGVSTATVPAKDVRELISQMKANPGKFNYATPGNGTTQHVGMELLRLRESLDLLHVPHKSINDANASLVGGHVHMMLGSAPAMKALESAGKIKMLAVTGPQRSPAAPEIPTFGEMGFTYMNSVDAWWAMAAPAKTPPAIVARLNRELRDALALPEIAAALAKQALVVAPTTSDELQALIKSDLERWGDVIRTANITAD
ncbi:MAG: tripartite tricarboxylate transporter substrate binding protein [Betaproteobacteria bacterium]|nr:tripartite tricarboxylate transporter substrate binding protein [Betaproteobacteria bacterium]